MKATVSHPPPVVQPPAVVTLEMTEREAEILLDLANSVIGDEKQFEGARVANAIGDALRDGGVEESLAPLRLWFSGFTKAVHPNLDE